MHPSIKSRRGFSYLVAVAICISVTIAIATIATLYSYGIVGLPLIPQSGRIEFMGSAVAARTSPNSVKLCFYVKNLGYNDIFISSIMINNKYALIVKQAKVLSGLGKAGLSGGTLILPAGALVEICGKVTTNIKSGQIIKIALEDVSGNIYYTFRKVAVYESGNSIEGIGGSQSLSIGGASPGSQGGSPSYGVPPQEGRVPQANASLPSTTPPPQQLLPDTGSSISLSAFRVLSSGTITILSNIKDLIITDALYYLSYGFSGGIAIGYGPDHHIGWCMHVNISDSNTNGNKVIPSVDFKFILISNDTMCNVKIWAMYLASNVQAYKHCKCGSHGLDFLVLVTEFCKTSTSKLLKIMVYRLSTATWSMTNIINYTVGPEYLCKNCTKVVKAWLTPMPSDNPNHRDYKYYIVSLNLGDNKENVLQWLVIAFNNKGSRLWIKSKGEFRNLLGRTCYEISTFRWADNLLIACKYVNNEGYRHYAFFKIDVNSGEVPRNTVIVTTEQLARKVNFNGFIMRYLDEDPRTKDYNETYVLYTTNSMRLYMLNLEELIKHQGGDVDISKLFYSRANDVPMLKPLSNAKCLGYGISRTATIVCYAKVKDLDNGMEKYGVFLLNLGYNGSAKFYEKKHGLLERLLNHKYCICYHGNCICFNYISEAPYYFAGWLISKGKPKLTVIPIMIGQKKRLILLVAVNGSSLTVTYLYTKVIDHPLPSSYNGYELSYKLSFKLGANSNHIRVGEESKFMIEGIDESEKVYTLWSWGDEDAGVVGSKLFTLTHTYEKSGYFDASALVLKSFMVGAPAYSDYVSVVVSK